MTRKAKPKASTKKPLLCLVMMVKNEARSIETTIESVRGIIDRWCILDTGSTDGTQEKIRATTKGIPGELHEEPFVDYGATRNRVLDLAGEKTVFALMLSGDESVTNPEALRAFCEQNRGKSEVAYTMSVTLSGLIFDHARLTRTQSRARYKGSYHEALAHPPTRRVPGSTVFHDPTFRDVSEQYRRGILLLLNELSTMDRTKDESHYSRTLFYIAQTYECLGQRDLAAEYYRRRVEAPSWPEENYEALFRQGRLALRFGNEADGEKLLTQAWSTRPCRAEPLFELADHFHKKDDHARTCFYASVASQLPFPALETLFVDSDIYEWKASDLFAVHAFYLSGPIRDQGHLAAIKAAKARPDDARLKSNVEHYERTQASNPPKPLLSLQEQYELLCDTPSDINEHLPILKRLASECAHVTEMGTRTGVSTIALLAGEPKELVCYDLVKLPQVGAIEAIDKRTHMTFHEGDDGNTLTCDIAETDFLFIDTWHVYRQLKAELDRHAVKVTKYIAMHDTTTFGDVGESDDQSDGRGGMWPAVEEFLADHKLWWTLDIRLSNNNGLTILRRK